MPCNRRTAICIGVNIFIGSGLIAGVLTVACLPHSIWSDAFPTHPTLVRGAIGVEFVILICIQACVNISCYYPYLEQMFRNRQPVLQEAIPLRQLEPVVEPNPPPGPGRWNGDQRPVWARVVGVNGTFVPIA